MRSARNSGVMGAWIAASLAGSALAASAPPTAHPQTPATRRMVERLDRISRDVDFQRMALLTNDKRAQLALQRLQAASGLRAQVLSGAEAAVELLRDGRTQQAIDQFEKVMELGRANSDKLSPTFWPKFKAQLALSYLRLGEQENCLCLHSTDSCLLPISGSGVHTKKLGSQKAVQLYTELLRENPDDLSHVWLLNIAYQTLGEYPASVPPQWLIPPEAFASDHDIKRFVDVAPHLGLAEHGLAGGCIVDDFDNDGYLDVFASNWSLRGQLKFFRNNGDGTFEDRTEAAGLTGLFGGLNLVQTDYNNDGFIDVHVLRGAWLMHTGEHPDSLLRNNGDGTFDDVTEEAGLLSLHPNQTASWGDFDNDGWLDLFVGNESGFPFAAGDAWAAANGLDPNTPLTHPCQLYHNNGNGTFTEITVASGVAHVAYVKGAVWGDYNNDGRIDLYLSCLGAPNVLYRNDGPKEVTSAGAKKEFAWTFTDVTAQAGVSEPIISFPTWFWDFDNDGWLDIFAAGYRIDSMGDVAADYLGRPFKAVRPHLYHNNRDGTFTEVGAKMGLDTAVTPMGANFGDLDNDGWLDFYLGTGDPDFRSLLPNRAFRSDAGRGFQDVTTSGGLGHLQKGHGVSFADIDNDGDQDIYHVLGGAYTGDVAFNTLFLNPGHGHHWITLKLEGTRSNRAGVGARIKVVAATESGEREIHRCVGSGGSFGAGSFQEEIGLGAARSVKSIEIRWPSGAVQTITDVAMDAIYRIHEGQADVQRVNSRVLDLRLPAEE